MAEVNVTKEELGKIEKGMSRLRGNIESGNFETKEAAHILCLEVELLLTKLSRIAKMIPI